MKMKRTCKGCKRSQKIMIRGQWSEVCKLNGRPIPWKTCLAFDNRNEAKQ